MLFLFEYLNTLNLKSLSDFSTNFFWAIFTSQMLSLLTAFLSVGYLCLDTSLSGVSFYFPSSHLFYPRCFIKVSGSEPSDGLGSCLDIVLVTSP